MNIKKQKRLIWLLAIFLGTVLLTLSLQSLSGLYSISQDAKVTDDALNIIEPRKAEAGRLTWQADNLVSPRQLETLIREDITSDYLLAFEELTYSLLTGDTSGLESYFQEGALDDVLLAASSDARSKFIDWDHNISLNFYAPDGATIALTDTYRYAQGIPYRDDLLDIRIAERDIQAIVTLDDGNWRIHHWRVLRDEPIQFVQPQFRGLEQAVTNIQGINYIAREAAFDLLWPNFDAAEVEADFATIARLNLNTVRFFIPYPAPEGLENLPTFLDLAHKHNLRVIPTLLDSYTRYRLEDIPNVLNYLDDLSESLRTLQYYSLM